MTEEQLAAYISERKSIREISALSGKGYGTIRYWLDKYGLKTKPKREKTDLKVCIACGETEQSKFYPRRIEKCIKCHNIDGANRQTAARNLMVQERGGKCSICGYNRCIAALEFHHTDKSRKSPSFTYIRGWSLENIRKELEECILVCSNCHREIEHPNLVMPS